jgi:inner membrane protein
METIEKTTGGFINSVGFKLALIGLLTLLLLIPASMILGLIREREQRKTETIMEVSSTWGDAQTISGPVLTIPYETIEKTEDGKLTRTTNDAHFLPEKLNISGTIYPETRKRGIYKVVTYRAVLHISGSFTSPDPASLTKNQNIAVSPDAYLEIGIPDMRGINEEPVIQWDSMKIPVVPGLMNSDIFESGVHGTIGLTGKVTYDFSYTLDLNGSQSLSFLPLGKVTNVQIGSNWKYPSFNGAFLPDQKDMTNGFKALWNILQLNRNYPQLWVNKQYSVNESSFGVELLTPVDTYQKSERSAKYAILFIGLTFLVFFFAEIMTKTRVHAVNYLLSGFALCIFYSLLIALAEHISFNLAYLIAGVTIISMIGIFSNTLYKNRKVTLTVVSTLCVLYVFLFVILQMMDYSLLFGNIGLVFILGIIMFFSRKIDWYSPLRSSKNNSNLTV